MLGSPILCLKGMRLMMFQLSSFYCRWVLRRFCKGTLQGFFCVLQGFLKGVIFLQGFLKGSLKRSFVFRGFRALGLRAWDYGLAGFRGLRVLLSHFAAWRGLGLGFGIKSVI